MNLFQPLGLVPPTLATEPVSTLSSHRQRAVCQPPSFPAPEARQVCEEKRPGAPPMSAPISRTSSASIPHMAAAYSGVYSA